MRFFHLLSFRLFILIVLILTVLTIGYSLYYVSLQSTQYEEIARQCAERTSRIIVGSTKNAMLLNKKDSAFEIMKLIRKELKRFLFMIKKVMLFILRMNQR
jgi:hypothetical protein